MPALRVPTRVTEKDELKAATYQRRKAERPAEILDAGLEEFYERGFAKASLARIAERAGVSRATVYLYFDGKDALFEAVAEAAMNPFIEELSGPALEVSGTTEEIVRSFLGRFYKMMTGTKNSALMRILIAEGRSQPALVARYHTMIIRKGEAALRALVERGLARGELRRGAVDRIPHIILAPSMFYFIHTVLFGDLDEIDQDAFFEAHLDMLFNGIAARGSGELDG